MVRYYGTLRAFPATHYSSGVLTDRNKHELPQCLYCDDAFAANWATSRCRELPQRMAVSPRFAEWLMGLPENWTHPELPLVNRCEHFVFRSKFALWGRARHPTISLFSGCGALDFSLLPWCAPIPYCEIDHVARGVLQNRMHDGSLPRGFVFEDIRLLTKASLVKQSPGLKLPTSLTKIGGHSWPPRVFAGSLAQTEMQGHVEGSIGLVYGFPRADTSNAGKKAGLDGGESALVFEALRIADDLNANWMFMENVAGIRSTKSSDVRLIDAVREKGFQCRWLMLEALNGGSPQKRKRWFMLAWRGGFHPSFLIPAPPQGERNLHSHIVAARGLDFNGGRPSPPASWMVEMGDYAASKPRLELLGRCVVPHQAMLAASLLSHGPEDSEENRKDRTEIDQVKRRKLARH